MTNLRLMELLAKLKAFKVTHWDTSSAKDLSKEKREPARIGYEANVVSSYRVDYPVTTEDVWGFDEPHHALLLDLDLPAYLVPSSTPGNSHLYVDVAIPEGRYFELLDLLAECGVIQPGYAEASKKKGGTALRLPWIKKNEDAEALDAWGALLNGEVAY